MNILIVLPSYNEKENITLLIRGILALNSDYMICVVDDNSPDGTVLEIENFCKTLETEIQEKIHVIVRDAKEGRGSAVRAGLEWGLKSPNKFDAFVEMDCDFSHSPSDLKTGLQLLKDADVVIGSRYPNGEIIGWSLHRRIFSYLSNLLIRALLNRNIYDYTNGFRFYSRKSAEILANIPQRHTGYIYLSETLAVLMKHVLTVKSFPITFVNRTRGQSNTTLKEILYSVNGIFSIAWRYWFAQQD